jgi:uncharacterized protein (DUF58 family)
MYNYLREQLTTRYHHWIDRRNPMAAEVTLNQRRIFIFPSRAGFAFLFLLLVMLIAAINYQKNMAFALVFLLACVFFISVLHTYANLSGLTLKALPVKKVFVGDSIPFAMQLSRRGSAYYYDINLSWEHSDKQIVSLLEHPQQRLILHLPASKRGYFKPGRLLLETCYPLGLLRAWSWVALDFQAMVYPQPIAADMKPLPASDGEEGEAMLANGSDDFYGLRDYQPGDHLKHVFWKSYAKGRDLSIKQYAGYRQQQLWLDWQAFDGPLEKRLSHLCYWALKLEQQQQEYGLRLPAVEILPAVGAQHQASVLKALALCERESV